MPRLSIIRWIIRPIPRPSAGRLGILVAGWTLLGAVAVGIWALVHVWGRVYVWDGLMVEKHTADPHGHALLNFGPPLEYLDRKLHGCWSEIKTLLFEYDHASLSLLVPMIGILGGCSHYLGRRARAAPQRQALTRFEWIPILVLMLGLSAYPAFRVGRCARRSMAYRTCIGEEPDRTSEIDRLVAARDFPGAVRAMESWCADYETARPKVGPDYERILAHPPTPGNPFGFLPSHLYEGWDSLAKYMPPRLWFYFNVDFQVSFSSVPENSDRLPQLFREMCSSRTPILHALGLILVGDYDAFCQEVYRRADAREPAFIGLARSVAYQLDADQRRTIHHLLILRRQGNEVRDNILVERACKVIEAGQDLGPDLEELRQIAKVYLNSDAFHRGDGLDLARRERIIKPLGL